MRVFLDIPSREMNWHCHQLNNDFARVRDNMHEAYEILVKNSTEIVVREWQIRRRPDYSTKMEARRIPFFVPDDIPSYERVPTPEATTAPPREPPKPEKAALIEPMKDPPKERRKGRVTKKELQKASPIEKKETDMVFLNNSLLIYIKIHT